ncbi:MAG: hypothetical protein DMG86_23445 [Acidobacteria bacterium]|nr:MAG: hypothetical protein DMG86_23445 [Acidobacteriota bacterium]
MAKARNPRGMPSPELLDTCNTLHRSTRNLLIQIFLSSHFGFRLQTVLSDTSTPAGIEVALKQLGKSADIRLAALGRKYLNTIGSPFPNLISDEGKQTLQRMGIESKALPARQNTPALEPGFVRFQDSRGGVHDIPQGNLKAAQQRDPNLRVMQQ